MDTDLVGRLAQYRNIAGIKHTDHEVGRIAREAAVVAKSTGCKSADDWNLVAEADPEASFTVLGGASDYLIGTLSVGGKGAITGMANITPRVLVKVYDLFQAGEREQALELAGVVSRSEWAIGKGGILGTKVSDATGLYMIQLSMRERLFCLLTGSTPSNGQIPTPHQPLLAASLCHRSRMPCGYR